MASTAKRPGSLTFVAVVLIILGAWTGLGALMNAPGMIFTAISEDPGPPPPGRPPGAADIHRMFAKETVTYYPIVGGLMVVSLLFGIGQLWCGIGLMKMNPARRMPAILITLAKMLFSFAGDAYQVIVLGPALERFMQAAMVLPPGPQGQPAPPMPINIGQLTSVFMTIGVAISVIIQVAIFLTITLILTSGTVKAALADAATPAPEDDADKGERRRERSRYEGYDDDEYPPTSKQPPPDTGITDKS